MIVKVLFILQLREQINSDQRMHLLLERHVDASERLFSLYDDKDGLRKEEVAALSGPNEIGEFYSRLKQIRDFHKKHPNEVSGCTFVTDSYLSIYF